MLAVAGWSYVQVSSARLQLEKARTEQAAERAQAATALAGAHALVRETETQWRKRLDEVQRDAVKARADARAASESARLAVERLQQRAAWVERDRRALARVELLMARLDRNSNARIR